MATSDFDPRTYHPDATALLELTVGETVPNFRELLLNYAYHQDKADRAFWHCGESNDGLMFHNDNTICVIVGASEENIDNANYVLSGAGWDGVTLHSVDIKAEAKVLECCKTLAVQDVERYWAEQPFDTLEEPQPIAQEHEQHDPDYFTISESSMFGGNNGPEPPGAHKSERQVIHDARDQPSVVAAPTMTITSSLAKKVPSGDGQVALLQVIEQHVLTSMLPPPDHPVIQALRAAGYEVKFVLSPI